MICQLCLNFLKKILCLLLKTHTPTCYHLNFHFSSSCQLLVPLPSLSIFLFPYISIPCLSSQRLIRVYSLLKKTLEGDAKMSVFPTPLHKSGPTLFALNQVPSPFDFEKAPPKFLRLSHLSLSWVDQPAPLSHSRAQALRELELINVHYCLVIAFSPADLAQLS